MTYAIYDHRTHTALCVTLTAVLKTNAEDYEARYQEEKKLK